MFCGYIIYFYAYWHTRVKKTLKYVAANPSILKPANKPMPSVKLITVISTHLTLLFEHYPTVTAINLSDVILYPLVRSVVSSEIVLIAILNVYFWSVLCAHPHLSTPASPPPPPTIRAPH